MVIKNDWVSKQIGLDAAKKYIEENDKPKQGEDLTIIKIMREDGIRSYTYIRPDGSLVTDKKFGEAKAFRNGKALVAYGDLGFPNYGYMDTEGVIHKSRGDGYYSDRKLVYDKDEKYHFVDREGNKVGGDYYNANRDLDGYTPLINLDYVDGYAVAKKQPHGKVCLIDKDGKDVPQENNENVVAWGNMGYGYYLAGEMDKINGVKLRDANTGVTIDRYNKTSTPFDIKEQVRNVILDHIGRQMPFIGYDTKEVVKRDGILFFGKYWFLGPSNLKVTKEQDGYHSKCEYGEFVTKLPPIKALDDNYILCAHNDAVYVYDKKNNAYGKSCSREDIEALMRQRNARKAYERIVNSIKAVVNYKKMNPGVNVKIALPKELLVCEPIYRDNKIGMYHDIQPVLLKFPAILEFITYIEDSDDHCLAVLQDGKRAKIDDVFSNIKKQLHNVPSLENIVIEEEPSEKVM